MPHHVEFGFKGSAERSRLSIQADADVFKQAAFETPSRFLSTFVSLKRVFRTFPEDEDRRQVYALNAEAVGAIRSCQQREAALLMACHFIGRVVQRSDPQEPDSSPRLEVVRFANAEQNEFDIEANIRRPEQDTEQVKGTLVDYVAPLACSLMKKPGRQSPDTFRKVLDANFTYKQDDIYMRLDGMSRMHALESQSEAGRVMTLKSYDVTPGAEPLVYLAAMTALANADVLAPAGAGAING